MCYKDEMHSIPHEQSGQGMCGCGCGGRKFLTKREKIEKLEEYSKMLKSELEGVEEKLKEIRGT
jgi:hypothetical protein